PRHEAFARVAGEILPFHRVDHRGTSPNGAGLPRRLPLPLAGPTAGQEGPAGGGGTGLPERVREVVPVSAQAVSPGECHLLPGPSCQTGSTTPTASAAKENA